MESQSPTEMLEIALSDAATAKALFAIDPAGLSAALAIVENDLSDHLDTVKSLHSMGEKDGVSAALKGVLLKKLYKTAGTKPAQTGKPLRQITVGQNKSPVNFNGTTMKRNTQKSFDDAAKKVSDIAKTLADAVNVNNNAKNILREAMARKTDGRLVNSTQAAATINIPTNRQPNQEKNAVTKFIDDEDTLEGTWSSQMKKEATGRMKGDTVASKTVEIPSIRTDSFNDTRNRLPFEFRGVNQSETVPVGFNLGATVDVVNPNGSAHGPVEFIGNTTPAVAGQTPNYGFPMKDARFPNLEKRWDVNLKDPKKPVQNQNPEGSPYSGAI